MSPPRRKKPTAPEVSFTIFDTAWGSAGLSWTKNGLCGLILPGLAPDQVEKEIRSDYPNAKPGDQKGVSKYIKTLERYFAGEMVELKAAIDYFGTTPFRKKVYATMLNIPYGRTISYAVLAERMGSPGAARAVGQAVAANRVPLFIPCHRVLATDGSPGGFSGVGGVVYKLRLLELESLGKKQAALKGKKL